jgi:hypothetical protein
MKRYDRERDLVPLAKHDLFEIEISMLAPGEDAPCITSLANGRLDKGAKVSAALQTVLYAQATLITELAGPLGIDLSLEVKRAPAISDVTWNDEQREADPEKEGVDGEERAVVE